MADGGDVGTDKLNEADGLFVGARGGSSEACIETEKVAKKHKSFTGVMTIINLLVD